MSGSRHARGWFSNGGPIRSRETSSSPADIDVVKLDLERTQPSRVGLHWNPRTATRWPPAPTSHRSPTGSSGWPGPALVERCHAPAGRVFGWCGLRRHRRRGVHRAGIAVCNNSGPGAEAVAEHALGFMLDLAKKITVADRVLRRGRLGRPAGSAGQPAARQDARRRRPRRDRWSAGRSCVRRSAWKSWSSIRISTR